MLALPSAFKSPDKETPDPLRMKLRKESEEPIFRQSNTLARLLKRALHRTERELPICRKSTTLALDPVRTKPRTENDDPQCA
jgi:hypothetical protein